METTYTYSIQNDTLNSRVIAHILQREVQQSSISIAIDNVNTFGDDLNIVFRGNLSDDEILVLNAIVSDHEGKLEILPTTVQILEEDPDPSRRTGGHFKSETLALEIGDGTEPTVATFTWKYPVSLLSVEWVGGTAMAGDSFSVCVAENTAVGSLTENAEINATTLSVSNSVVRNVFVGMTVKIQDGTNTEDLGYIIGVNRSQNTIVVENPLSQAFSAETPTAVVVSTEVLKDIEIEESTAAIQVGSTKIGGSYVPAGIPITVHYNNNDGVAGKRFRAIIEYLY